MSRPTEPIRPGRAGPELAAKMEAPVTKGRRLRREPMHSTDSNTVYIISAAARQLGLHANTLRKYERQGLVSPARSRGNLRLFSASDLVRLQQIKRLVEDRRVNLAGVEIVLDLTDRILALRSVLVREVPPGIPELCHYVDELLAAMLAASDPDAASGQILEDVDEPRRSDPRRRGKRRAPDRRHAVSRADRGDGEPV